MIFVTVGTQLPFDRLIRAVDCWAGAEGRRDVFAQVGPSTYRPRFIKWSQFVDVEECHRRVAECELTIAHAGMGSVIAAIEARKPIVVLPRRASLGEHRNDHQVATADYLARAHLAVVAWDEAQLIEALKSTDSWRADNGRAGQVSSGLIGALRAFIDGRPAVDVSLGRIRSGTHAPVDRASRGFPGDVDMPDDDLGVLGAG